MGDTAFGTNQEKPRQAVWEALRQCCANRTEGLVANWVGKCIIASPARQHADQHAIHQTILKPRPNHKTEASHALHLTRYEDVLYFASRETYR